MNLDLREFDSFPAEYSAEFEADNEDFGIPGVAFRDLMKIRVMLQKIKDEFYCQGNVMVPVEEECSRCLETFDTDLSGELNFIITTEESKAVLGTDTGAEVVTIKASEPVVDLNGIIKEALMLAIPMKPLCSEECRGLCPSCGANLNEEKCDCKVDETDERWEGLKDLLE